MLRRQGAPSPREIREELVKVLTSPQIHHSRSLCRFISYTTEETLAGRAHGLKEQVIGREVFDRGADFDTRVDPIVRVQARTLRQKLQAYYANGGALDRIRIEYPKGSYAPIFRHGTPARLLPLSKLRVSGAALLLLVGVAVTQGDRKRWTHPAVEVKQLTFDAGWTSAPAISADGTVIVYTSDRAEPGNMDIWVQSASGGEPRRLTRHASGDVNPDLSPDGRTVVFRSYRDAGGIYLVSAVGGAERLLAGRGYAPRFSPDGSYVAYTARTPDGNSAIYVVPVNGGKPTIVSSRLRNATYPVWSPDGTHVLFIEAVDEREETYDWWVAAIPGRRASGPGLVRTGASAEFQRNGLPAIVQGTVPTDWTSDSDVLFTVKGKGGTQLWSLPISEKVWKVAGPARQVMSGPNVDWARAARSNASGRMLAFASDLRSSSLWSVAIGPQTGRRVGELRRLTHDESLRPGLAGTVPTISMAGDRIAFASSRTGTLHVRLKDLLSDRDIAITDGDAEQDRPILSPRGDRILYAAKISQHQQLYVADVATGQSRLLCNNCGELRDWHEPTDRVLYVSEGRLWLRDLAGEASAPLLSGPRHTVYAATFSPCGQWIALSLATSGRPGVYGVVAPLGAVQDETSWLPVTTEDFNLALHWSSDGRSLYFFSTQDGYRCIWAQPLDPKTRRPRGPAQAIEHFHNYALYPWYGSWIATARNRLVVNLSSTKSNVYLASLP